MQNRYEENPLKEDRDKFLDTGHCPHNENFRTIVTVGKVKKRVCDVCGKVFETWFVR